MSTCPVELKDMKAYLSAAETAEQYVKDQGYNAKKFIEYFDSFGTDLRVKKGSRLANQYQITSVPTLIINGKYKTSGSLVSSFDELYDVVQLLIEKERVN